MKNTIEEGGPEKVALHATIGEIVPQLAGNPNGTGGEAAGINEVAIRRLLIKGWGRTSDQVQFT